jgi:beta-glucanase (GH16 family)
MRSDRVPGGSPGTSLKWSAEFDGAAGSRPDPGTWQMQTGGGGWGNEELQYYTGDSENACLDGAGHLAIVARRTDPRTRADRYGGCGYTSARLASKDRMTFCYGRLEARLRLPAGRGIWPGFWLLGGNIDQVGWPQCGEIDVMENIGQHPAVVHGSVHGPGYSGQACVTASHHASGSLVDDFHVYSIAWDPGRIRWYLDDQQYAAVTPGDLRGNTWVFDHGFFVLVNVAVGGPFPGRPDRSVTFPQAMLVDYIRLYATEAAG